MVEQTNEPIKEVDMESVKSKTKSDQAPVELEITEKFPIDETEYQIIKTKDNPYGMVRQVKNNQVFKFPDHKPQYDNIADAVIKNVQLQMVQTYNL